MDLLKVLDELYAEKLWLQNLICSLEIASRSPAQRFAATLINSLGERAFDGSILRLPSKKKEELARLARLVTRDGRKGVRSLRRLGPAAVSHHSGEHHQSRVT